MEEQKIVPRHVGIIMDGNGRWAKQRGKPRSYGHKKGADVIDEVVTACFERGADAVSLYAFSTENWVRPKEEVDAIFGLLGILIDKKLAKLIKNEVKLIISGDISLLPESLRKKCSNAVQKSGKFKGKVLNVALNYGSRAEITRAVNVALGSVRSEMSRSRRKHL